MIRSASVCSLVRTETYGCRSLKTPIKFKHFIYFSPVFSEPKEWLYFGNTVRRRLWVETTRHGVTRSTGKRLCLWYFLKQRYYQFSNTKMHFHGTVSKKCFLETKLIVLTQFSSLAGYCDTRSDLFFPYNPRWWGFLYYPIFSTEKNVGSPKKVSL